MRHYAAILLSISLCASAAAQPATDSGADDVEIIVVRPPDAAHPDGARGLVEPEFVTAVRPAHDRGDHSVADALAQTVGVRVRSLGGLGAYSSVSVRGAPSGHTAVLIDGVPLSRIAAVTVDLGRFDLAGVSQVEVYRGAVPVELGGAGVGGALHFVTATEAPFSTELTAGVGSFGARHLAARHFDSSADGTLHYQLAAGYSGATGDFDYLDDRGTNLNTDDDVVATRRNNGFDRATVLMRGRRDLGAGSVTAGFRVLAKRQGVPGSGAVQTDESSLTTATWIVDGNYRTTGTAWGRPGRLRAGVFALFDQQRYLDRLGEVGVASQDRSYTTASGGGQIAGDLAVSDRLTLSAAWSPTVDSFAERDHGTTRVGVRGRRIVTGAGVSARYAGPRDRYRVELAARAEYMRTVPTAEAGNAFPGDIALARRDDLSLSPRLSARVSATEALSVKASAGRYLRQPTLPELFGDRGFAVGNPELRPETGVSADAGLVFAPSTALGPLDRIYIEAAVFASRPTDTIAYVNTAAMVARPINIDSSRLAGAELVALARVAQRLSVTANYTMLTTEQHSMQLSFDGKELPRKPRHQAYARLDLDAGGGVRVFADSSYIGHNFLDRTNLAPVPRRVLFGAGASISLGRLSLAVDGRNLTDRRVESITLDPPPSPELTEVDRPISDFFGYPLPGRSVYATATLRL